METVETRELIEVKQKYGDGGIYQTLKIRQNAVEEIERILPLKDKQNPKYINVYTPEGATRFLSGERVIIELQKHKAGLEDIIGKIKEAVKNGDYDGVKTLLKVHLQSKENLKNKSEY